MVDIPRELSELLSGKLCESVAIVDQDQLTDDEREAVPGWWLEVAGLPTQSGIDRVIDIWQSVVPGAFAGFFEALRVSGLGVFLGRSDSEGKPLLAYAWMRQAGEAVCWYGFPPASALEHPSLDLTGFPPSVAAFYTRLHDGFRLAYFVYNGFPVSTELWAVGEDFTPGEAEVFGAKPPPNLDQLASLFFYTDAAAVCVELNGDKGDRRDGWIVADSSFWPIDDIWAEVDHWMRSLTEP